MKSISCSTVRILLLSCLLVGLAGCRQPDAPPLQAEADGDSRVAINAIVERFQSELDRLYEEAKSTDENFPGATAAFILPGGQVHAFATGMSDVEQGIPMDKDLRMPSGSIGKSYVAAVAVQLAQQGEIDLDQKISTWLGSEDWFSQVPNGEDLTLRILLSHTGGLIDHAFASEAFADWAKSSLAAGDLDAVLTPRELVGFVLGTDPLFPAGEGYSYTDTGYILAGIVMEEATGRTYYDMLNEFFLGPLELSFTLPADRRDLPNLAQGYAHASSELFGTPLRIVEEGAMVLNPLSEWTGGGLVNNPQDLVRWAKALYEGDAIAGDGELDDLLNIGFVEDAAIPTDGYGLGVYIRKTPLGLVLGHGGFYPGYNSRVGYFPDHRVAVAIQINSDDSQVPGHLMTLAEVVLSGLAAENHK